jgi:bifunctional non-homologous end joining protein LigD
VATATKATRLRVRERSDSRKAPSSADGNRPLVAGIGISHPERLIFSELRLSKLDFARYFEQVSDWIVPHVAGRPLTLLHCPSGADGRCMFLKHAKAWGPTALRRVNIQEKTKVGEYLVADSVSGVVALAQMGVIEIHTWNSTAGDIERPNRIVWDLDPGPAVRWADVVEGAELLRNVLKTLGLESWVKTTGGRGLHVVVPIKRGPDWSACLAFSKHVSEAIVRSNPSQYTTMFTKRGREGKILFDYLRNNRTNTSISAYSPRARAGAPVSVPIDWTELRRSPPRWTLATIARRLRRVREDPWTGYWLSTQRLTNRALQAITGV